MILMIDNYKIIIDKHSENIPIISITFFVFHFDISGNDFNDEHLLNNKCILVIFLVSHFDMSGNNLTNEQL